MFSPYRLCVYSIVKDEMHNIDRYLEQVKTADEIVILDTGSTDGTYEYLLTKQSDKLKVYQKHYDLFRFDEGRNDALQLTSDECDIYISIEPDMILCHNWVNILKQAWNDKLTYLVIPQYFVASHTSGIWHAHKKEGINWKYPVHELPLSNDENAKTREVIKTVIIHDFDAYKASHKQYLPLSELGVKETNGDVYAKTALHKVKTLMKAFPLDKQENEIKDRTIIVTGGAGSIGKQLVKRLSVNNKVIALDTNQDALEILADEASCLIECGSIENENFINQIFEKYEPSIIIHCAAQKYINIGEDNPIETMNINIGGTINIFSAVNKYRCGTCIFLSSNAANNPNTIYGQTKALGEKLIESYNELSESRYIALRLCNVYDSNGSAPEILKEKMLSGQPLTITKGASRQFITIDEVVECIFKVYAEGDSGKIYAPKNCRSIEIEQLARNIASDCRVDFNTLAIEYIECPEDEKLQSEFPQQIKNILLI